MLSSYDLTVAGRGETSDPNRVFYRDPGTSPKDLVIWLQNGEYGTQTDLYAGGAFLDALIAGASNRIDLGPNALWNATERHFMVPGDDSVLGIAMPPSFGDDYADLRFLSAIVADVASRFPSVTRIWLAGSRNGGRLALAAFHFNAEYAVGARGYFDQGNGIPKDPPTGSYDWEAGTPTRRPIGFLSGDTVNPPAHTRSHQQSWDAIKLSLGHTAETSANLTCSGVSLKRKTPSGGTKPGRWWKAASGNDWTPCATGYAIELFTLDGFGT